MMAPNGRSVSELPAFPLERRSWKGLLAHVRQCRAVSKRRSDHGFGWGGFQFASLLDDSALRIYSLGLIDGRDTQTILYADVVADTYEAHWRQLIDDQAWSEAPGRRALSKEEELLRERMRIKTAVGGVASFHRNPETGVFLISTGTKLWSYTDPATSAGGNGCPVELALPSSLPGTAMDPKAHPADDSLLAFFCAGEVYLKTPSGASIKATSECTEDGIFAGSPCFIIQEEFDRYTGIWWCPTIDADGTTRLLYEVVDETMVERLNMGEPSAPFDPSESSMRYPLAGATNATCLLKLLEVNCKTDDVACRSLNVDLKQLFPWYEYLARVGWTPDGQGVCAQLVSRRQDRIAVVYIPVEQFSDASNNSRKVTVLYDETSDIWINCNNSIYFLKSPTENEVHFIWSSERSGFNHLYLIKSRLGSTSIVEDNEINYCGPYVLSETAITEGNWAISLHLKPVVTDDESHVYFWGTAEETPLEHHVYVAAVHSSRPSVRRLTELGKTTTSLGPEVVVHPDFGFIVWESNISEQPRCVFHRLNKSALPAGKVLLTVAAPSAISDHDDNPPSPPMDVDGVVEPKAVADADVSSIDCRLFSYVSERCGATHYALLYCPMGWTSGRKYPVLLYVYAGPHVQLVRNVYPFRMNFQKYTKLGFAVVVVDARGSSSRGLQFEGHLKYRMGQIEIGDQVEGLENVARQSVEQDGPILDLDRVAVTGWSYGGYAALLAITERPDLFKVAVSGAPVTNWRYYDTGYTERYMGLPAEQNDAYEKGSVVNQAHLFPDEPGRLLILHGLIDENVHFRNTEQLVAALIKRSKPYSCQVFPKERHGVRESDANDHMDVTIVNFLLEYFTRSL